MKKCYFLIFFLSIGVACFSQQLLPPIQNYNALSYNAASKNWGLSVSENGELFVANNYGLLHFNGQEWKLYRLPNKTVVRSVAYIDGKIFTGSYEEFGYWQKDEVGNLVYLSLTHLIKDHEFTNEEFWQIMTLGTAIYFRSFSGIYKYENNAITYIPPGFVVTYMTVTNNQLVIAGNESNLSTLHNDKVYPLENYDVLSDKVVSDMDPLENGLLVGTKLNGCFLLNNGEAVPFDEDLNKELRKFQLNQVVVLSRNKIAFGTIKNGVYLYNVATRSYVNINRETGMQNNTVLSMLLYKNQLWLGLDNGMDLLQLDSPMNYFTDYTGTVGMVYDLAYFNGTTYMGSNTGVYYFKDDKVHFVEGTQGHVWDMEIIDGELFCGHNTGTFKINGDTLKRVSTIAGGYQMVKVPEQPKIFLQGTYTGIAKYERDPQNNWTAKRITNFDYPVKYLCFENATTLWAAHPYKGLFKITLDQDLNQAISVMEFGTDRLPSIYNIKIYTIKNSIILQSDGQWFRYDPISDRIEDFKEFEPYKNKDLVYVHEGNYWFIDNNGSKEVIYTDLKNEHLVLDDKRLRNSLSPESENVIRFNDSIVYFTLADGFGKLNVNQLEQKRSTYELPVPTLSTLQDDQRYHLLEDSVYEIPYKASKNIIINTHASSSVNPRFYYKLQGRMDDDALTDNGSLHFRNLPYGDYELDIATVGFDNSLSKPLRIFFSISPPWYLSVWMRMIYVFIGLGAFFAVRWFNKVRLKKKEDRLKDRMQREQKDRMAQIEKDELAKGLKLKQKELASTTMLLAKKNELILELKNILEVNKDKFSSPTRYKSIIRQLDDSVDADTDWQNFEMSFKEVHEDFFENLIQQHPKLTARDLKLCAYLKMNLSSKEIAPLMAISIRGVEIHRYRLRKKLNLDSTQNLNNYLHRFK